MRPWSLRGEGGVLPCLVDSVNPLGWAERPDTKKLFSQTQATTETKLKATCWNTDTHQIWVLGKQSWCCLHAPPQCTVAQLESRHDATFILVRPPSFHHTYYQYSQNNVKIVSTHAHPHFFKVIK